MQMKQRLEKIIQTLKQNHQTISMAESCTGGRVAAAFTAIAGVSAVFNGSCVTYSNTIKHLWLGVKEETLAQHGAVSSACVKEMLEGIKAKADSSYALAISGIAGPDGGSPDKPVGTVYIGLLTPTQSIIKCYHFTGDRESVQRAATEEAIRLFEEKLEKRQNTLDKGK